jgi:hypothetical protein
VTLREQGMIHGAVVHPANEQPFTADLFAMPTSNELTLVCTNVRTSSGKRPVWADAQSSIYYFPWLHIRFVEIPETAASGVHAEAGNGAARPAAGQPVELDRESELEIDEEFLRRVRDV